MKDKSPIWFWMVSSFFLLWNILGLFSFFSHVFISEETLSQLPADQMQMYAQYPLWTDIVFAIAVFSGLAGSLALLLRKSWSYNAFLISICAIIPQMIHNVFFTDAMQVYGLTQSITMPILVVLFGVLLLWFSKRSISKNWFTN